MDLDEIRKLIDLCREKGVQALELNGVKLVLGPAPPAAPTFVAAPAVAPQPRTAPTPVQEVEALERRLLKGRRFGAEVTKS